MEPTPAAELKTNPPAAAVYDAEEEQRALTLALMTHPDPFVRLIAHISERQLTLSEIVRIGQDSTTDSIKKLSDRVGDLTSEVHQLTAQVSTLAGSQTALAAQHNALEARFSGGNSHASDSDEASAR